ncbi:MAG: M67 family peptidase, partial [Chloroflexi bacterium]
MAEIRIRHDHWQQMLDECRNRAPIEACGLVAGKDGESIQVFPAENALQSPVRYRLDPRQQLQILLEIDALNCDLLAIYHSHPLGPSVPSET